VKNTGDFDRKMSIQQHEGGYVVSSEGLGRPPTKVFKSFEEVVNYLAQSFGLVMIGEQVQLISSKSDEALLIQTLKERQ
jgi:hypothetical protein